MTDDLLIKYLALEATAAEQQRVDEWVSLSSENRRYFNQLKKIWDGSEELEHAYLPDEEQAWERFQQRVLPSVKLPEKKKNKWISIAAGFLLVVASALLTYQLVNTKADPPTLVAVNTADKVRTDTLPDGSVATLNKHSTISYLSTFPGKTRQVKLKGEAFFNVTADKQKPFIIDVNEVTIRVVGTSFNVRNLEQGTEVIVETGLVQVMKGTALVELHAGERVFIPATDSVAQKVVSNDKLYNYYVSRTFVCDNTPLWKLVDKLNEAYGANISIGRNELRRLPLTVTFNEESLDVILNIISQTLLVKITRGESSIIIN